MKLISTIALLIASVAMASPQRFERPIKLPSSQQILHKQSIDNAILADPNRILVANAGDVGSGAVVVSVFAAQPDVPRTVSVTPGGTTADVAAGNVIVAGTNIRGSSISENIAISGGQSTKSTGLLAFRTVSSITLPAETGGFAATWDVGVDDQLGLNACVDSAGHIFQAVLAGAKEATDPSMVVDGDEIEKNTADPDGALDGAKDLELYYLRNFRCF